MHDAASWPTGSLEAAVLGWAAAAHVHFFCSISLPSFVRSACPRNLANAPLLLPVLHNLFQHHQRLPVLRRCILASQRSVSESSIETFHPPAHPTSTINGYLFCNGATNLTFKQGEPARWHMASLGSETDV